MGWLFQKLELSPRTLVGAVGLLWLLTSTSSVGRVVTYPAPEGEVLSDVYRVWADGVEVPVYRQRVNDPPFHEKYDHGGTYAFAVFDCAGPVTVRIESSRSLKKTVLRPQVKGVSLEKGLGSIEIQLKGPTKLSVEPDGKRSPLLLFANPIEKDTFSRNDPNVVYFGPGIHKPVRINLTTNQTLYLAGGSIVKGSVTAKGDNITIRGRGILDGNDWAWRKGPGQMISMQGCRNVVLRDIVIRGAWGWTVVPKGCSNVRIRNLKICNSRVQNDDGINPCNSQNVHISNCFIRSDDDCIALKGIAYQWPNNNVENIRVENTILWCDRARIFLLGHESRAKFMRNIRMNNLDIIHFTMIPFLLEPGEEMHLTDAVFSDIRIHGEGQRQLVRLRPVVNQYMHKKTPGRISNITFRDINLKGREGEYSVDISGHDADHATRNVTFDRFIVRGKSLATGDGRLRVGAHTSGIVAKAYDDVAAYDGETIGGFRILINREVKAHPAVLVDARQELKRQIAHLSQVLPAAAVESLKDTTIWVEWRAKPNGAAEFHPSKKWLENNGYNPEKQGCVEINNARNFVNWSRNGQPCMVLHELAHAYHLKVLGHGDERVKHAYKQAVAARTYEAVKHVNGRTNRAYALSNEKEYLAELSEAYFGKNDFYPFTRAELAEHDPEGFKMIQQVWRVDNQ